MRRLLIVLAALAAILTVAVIGASVWLRTAGPQLDGEVALEKLSAPVEVWRDSLAVPHLWATSMHDLLYAQGFVHAQDRLWQMELFRRVAEGRLAELLGDGLIETDQFLRTIGLWRAAIDQVAAVPPGTMELLQAYADGVNAFIEEHRGALPPEFVVLRTRPEPWTPHHSLAIERIMAWDLGAYGFAAAVTRTTRQLGSERAARLAPAYPDWGPTILELPEPPAVAETTAAFMDAISITRASNAWVIGGSRTRSGKPILANDMHLALRAPAIWYLAALHAPGFDVAGMTLPGVPFVVAGHNRAVAWGFTNASLDDADLFVERIDPADSARYLTPDGSQPFVVLEDSIRVSGRDAAVPLRIRLTRHGPIITDLADPEARGPIALRWAGHDASGTIAAIRMFNSASDWNDFIDAMRVFDNPHQNVVYADTSGDFGYAMGGRIPARGRAVRNPPRPVSANPSVLEGEPATRESAARRAAPTSTASQHQTRASSALRPPVLPVPGWTGEWDWHGYLPFDLHPVVRNPVTGYVVTANNRQAAGDIADRISSYWEQPYRAARIRALILESHSTDADAVHLMQHDVHDALAARYRALAVRAAQQAERADAARTLGQWDLRAARDSYGAALFYTWYESLNRRVSTVLYDGEPGLLPRAALDAILDARALFWGDTTVAAFERLAALAMIAADSVAGGRTWGELHYVRSAHALSVSALLDRIFRLDVGPFPGHGSPTSVSVSDFAPGTVPVLAAYGPSQRHVVDMADVDGSGGFVLPTGQSGIPFSRHYRDQHERWRDGGLWRIPLDRAKAEARAVYRLTLRPAR